MNRQTVPELIYTGDIDPEQTCRNVEVGSRARPGTCREGRHAQPQAIVEPQANGCAADLPCIHRAVVGPQREATPVSAQADYKCRDSRSTSCRLGLGASRDRGQCGTGAARSHAVAAELTPLSLRRTFASVLCAIGEPAQSRWPRWGTRRRTSRYVCTHRRRRRGEQEARLLGC
jgi:hypothetical protein